MDKSYNHAQTEKEWYRRWEESGLFTADSRSPAPPFSVILPPPNVTGSLHIGHAFTNTLPDILVRRKKMQGFNVLWLPGVDHAGIATQMVVERWLKKEKNLTKEEMGREKFLALVWEWKERSQRTIIEQIKKLGLSLDWTRMKFTFSDEMQRAVRRVFVSLYREGLIYQGVYMVNRCPSCKTVLSDLEVEHKEIRTQLTYIRYPLKQAKGKKKFVEVATTRPETMLGDTAVAVNPEDKRYRALIGSSVILPLVGREIPLIADAKVDKGFGTGAVKVTPAHDPFDRQLALAHDLPSIVVIDENGRMTGPIPETYAGLDRFACRQQLLADLRREGFLVKEEPYVHNIGHCHRCGTVVEPLVSRQWFLRMKELAAAGAEAVRKKETLFIPERWEKIFFNWMDNIQDWCISRQLWWGHRIPAATCRACQALTVAEELPHACPRCGSADIVHDEDVLDTWFSSALWPFITLGWQEGSRDFQVWYPTSLMVTAFDIIFFWVARMIIMGIHFCGAVPFRDVLINGLIRDEKGQKMSKTRNNVIDPLEVIAEYGADALRFTLAIQAVPASDIALSVGRVKGYRAFANKIWNASRYALLTLRGDEQETVDAAAASDADKWILHTLNQTVAKINDLLDGYKIYEAADRLYHFFWDEYCDWYLEFSKPDSSSLPTRNVLTLTLRRGLQLLHPFMPFLTEEIYQKLRREKSDPAFLVQTPFPQFESGHVFPEEHGRIETLKRVIAETRKTRTENQIPPGKKIAIFLKHASASERNLLDRYRRYFDFLARSERTEIVVDFPAGQRGFKGVVQGWEILLPFASDEDRLQELGRLRNEHKKISGHVVQLEERLGKPDFQEKAPADVVQAMKQNLQEAIEKKGRIERTIHDLS